MLDEHQRNHHSSGQADDCSSCQCRKCHSIPLTEYDYALAAIPFLMDWLQEKPRTTLDVSQRLFPNAIVRSAVNEEALLQKVGIALFDSGYAPESVNAINTLWRIGANPFR